MTDSETGVRQTAVRRPAADITFFVNRRVLAAFFEVTERTVRTWIGSGLPILRTSDGVEKFCLRDAVRWYYDRRAGAVDATEEQVNLVKLRKETARAEKEELQVGLLRGRYISRDSVHKGLCLVFQAFHDELVISLPPALSAELSGLDSEVERESRIKSRMIAALEELNQALDRVDSEEVAEEDD
jgi:hypothetical protein